MVSYQIVESSGSMGSLTLFGLPEILSLRVSKAGSILGWASDQRLPFDFSSKSRLLPCFLELRWVVWRVGIRDGFSSMCTLTAFTWKDPKLISAQNIQRLSRGTDCMELRFGRPSPWQWFAVKDLAVFVPVFSLGE